MDTAFVIEVSWLDIRAVAIGVAIGLLTRSPAGTWVRNRVKAWWKWE